MYHSPRQQHPTGNNLKSLLRCIQENNSKRLEKLLGRKASLHLGQDDLSCCLCEAILQGKGECVFPLLAHGANPNWVSEDGRTPLHLLVEQSSDPATIKAVLAAGASPNCTSLSSQQTPLHVAARKGYQVCIQALISSGARVDKVDAAGNTPLMYAAKEGHMTTVGMLLREDADPNMRNLQNETALHFASGAGHVDCVHELMNQGANPNMRDEAGQTPLFVACKAGQLLVVEALLDCNCDVNAQNANSGKTVLHWAVQVGDNSLVQILLHRGAEVNVRDNSWETPFMTALNMGRIDVIRLLIQAGCHVTVTDKNFNTALHVAARDGHEELVPVLVKAGLDINLKGAGGLNPLMLACLGGHMAAAQTLLSHGANPDLLDRHRASALVCAIVSDKDDVTTGEVVKMLIRANCLVDGNANAMALMKSLKLRLDRRFKLQDRLYSPLELAFLKCRIVVFMLLLQAGCKLRHLDLNNVMMSSAQETLKGGDLKTAQYLLKCFNKEKFDIRPLKEMCRRHALAALGGNVDLKVINCLPVSEQIKRFLAYEDLDHLEQSFNMAFRDKRMSSDSKKLAPINEYTSTSSSFLREDRRRQTYHGRRSAPAKVGRSPQASIATSPTSPLSPSPSPGTSAISPSLFNRAGSLRIPRSKDSKLASSVQNIRSPTSLTSVGWPRPRSRPTTPPKSTTQLNNSTMYQPSSMINVRVGAPEESPGEPGNPPRKRLGSPDTGYSSTCSSCADWTSPTGALGLARKDQKDLDSFNQEPTSPGGSSILSKWSTQDDINSVTGASEDGLSNGSMDVKDESPVRSKIPVFQRRPSPSIRQATKDDIITSRIPKSTTTVDNSNFTRSRSFRKY